MQINVSQLLQEVMGASRDYEVSDEVDIAGDGNCRQARGKVRLLRTHRGILVRAELNTEIELACSRCLRSFYSPVTLKIEEEYISVVDIVSGTPLPAPEEPGAFVVDEHHVIDLTEAIRQYALLAVPMKPLCKENCAGLCPVCGNNLNQESCRCPEPVTDPRWSELSKLGLQ
ncbi:MAG: DUF177 domain-containing protein [Dehalococcoidales bacterium]